MTVNSLRNSRKIQSFLLLVLFAGMSWGLLAPGAFRFLRSNPFSPFALFNDVMLHFCVFAFVMLCFALAFSRGETGRIRTIALLLGAHGVITEILQAFIPTRTCDPLDLAANFIGIAIGCKLALMYFAEKQPATSYAERT